MTLRLLEPCQYETHRPTDWLAAAGGPLVCGVCHPPASPDSVIRRGEEGFDDLEADHRARQRAAEVEGAERRQHLLELEIRARQEADAEALA